MKSIDNTNNTNYESNKSGEQKTDIIRDCRKCVYELSCHGNPVGCKKYKRDAPDGGYYG